MINNLFQVAVTTMIVATPAFAQWGAVDAEVELTMKHCGEKYNNKAEDAELSYR